MKTNENPWIYVAIVFLWSESEFLKVGNTHYIARKDADPLKKESTISIATTVGSLQTYLESALPYSFPVEKTKKTILLG